MLTEPYEVGGVLSPFHGRGSSGRINSTLSMAGLTGLHHLAVLSFQPASHEALSIHMVSLHPQGLSLLLSEVLLTAMQRIPAWRTRATPEGGLLSLGSTLLGTSPEEIISLQLITYSL
jgi:hypothetical protein